MLEQKGRRENDEGKRTRSRVRRCLLAFLGLAYAPLWTAGAQYSGGSGTPQAPFLISTPADFKTIGATPADWDKRFRLTTDLDLSDYNEVSLHMIGHWVALGSITNQPFRGEFDGNGKTISNFHYHNMSDDYVGLFQYVSGTVKNLRLDRPRVVGNKMGVGALVGCLENGGLIGCSVTRVSVSGNARVGGLAGNVDGAVTGSCSDGSVSGVLYVGGLIGQVAGGNITSSFSKAKVAGSNSVGGLVGVMLQQDDALNSCYARGEVQGTSYVGGLVGQVSAGHVWRCYSAGKVTGAQYTGGLVGLGYALADVMAGVWDTQTSQQTKSAGGMGKTTAEMKTLKTFTTLNWDFYNIWTMCEGIGYPVFLWQIPPGDLVCPDGVNFVDFAWFALDWRRRDCGAVNGDCSGADLDKSGAVDCRDLAILAENWLAGIP